MLTVSKKAHLLAPLVLAMVMACAAMIYDAHLASAQTGQTCSPNRSVNVRSGPSVSYDVVGSLAKGEEITVVSTSGAWFEHEKGWTLGSLLQCGSQYRFAPGFIPDDGLIDLTNEVEVRTPAENFSLYKCFPQDYSEGDDHNPGCADAQEEGFPWGKERAGYNFGYNDACRDNTRECNIQITTWSWGVSTGEELYLPGVGSLRDPDGGASMVVWVNVWEVPGEFLSAYILHGYWALGQVWDMSDMSTTWNQKTESYENDQYGEFTLETAMTLRDHWIYQLTQDNGVFRGQCSKGLNCDTVTYAVVLRWFDGSFRLIDSGQVKTVKPQLKASKKG